MRGSGSPRHPPFEKDNTLQLRHGARSPRVVNPLADALVAEAVEASPYLQAPEYEAAVQAWARAEAQAMLLQKWVDDNGLVNRFGKVSDVEQALHRAETRAANARARLGLDPLSRARLGRDVTASQVSVSALLAARRAEASHGG
mgnify:CR=1 FL=1